MKENKCEGVYIKNTHEEGHAFILKKLKKNLPK